MAKIDKKGKEALNKNSSTAKKKLKSVDVQLKNTNYLESKEQKKTASFPIIGIGVSANGLAAIVDELKQSEKSLGESKKHLRMLIEQASDRKFLLL